MNDHVQLVPATVLPMANPPVQRLLNATTDNKPVKGVVGKETYFKRGSWINRGTSLLTICACSGENRDVDFFLKMCMSRFRRVSILSNQQNTKDRHNFRCKVKVKDESE